MGGSGGAREAEGADEQEAQALAAAHRVHEAVQGGRQPCAPQQAPQGGQQGQEGPREIGLNWQFDFSTSFLNSLILPTYSLGRFSLFVCNLCIISISHIEFCFSRFLSHFSFRSSYSYYILSFTLQKTPSGACTGTALCP